MILNSKVSKEAHLIGITSGGLSFKYCTVVFVSRVIFVIILKLLFHITILIIRRSIRSILFCNSFKIHNIKIPVN